MFLFQDAAYGVLSPMLSALDLDPLSEYAIIRGVIQRARQDSTSLVVADIEVVADHVRDETYLTRAAAAAAEETESGMVPAGEHAVKEMLSSEKEAKVEREDEECVVCMQELPRGSEAPRMPCGVAIGFTVTAYGVGWSAAATARCAAFQCPLSHFLVSLFSFHFPLTAFLSVKTCCLRPKIT